MDIVGGVYRELCEWPAWDAVLGSGGRAALAVGALSSKVRLHTYVSPQTRSAIEHLSSSGIEINGHPTSSGVAFIYLHPLSEPYIEPSPTSLDLAEPISVSADVVLRFGMLEGDAIVHAKRAIFDPQTAQDPSSFRENGSSAKELAIVLNEKELYALSGCDAFFQAAAIARKQEGASVIVAKCGVRGAWVFTDSEQVHIPAYRSHSVFKIGTGDVFTATFAFFWGEAILPPERAADQASRAVARYAETRSLPPLPTCEENIPVGNGPQRSVLVHGNADTLARRWLLEEARFRLRELGVEVLCPALDGTTSSVPTPEIVLLFAEALSGDHLPNLEGPISLIVLDETAALPMTWPKNAKVINDFTTALYLSAWEATTSRS